MLSKKQLVTRVHKGQTIRASSPLSPYLSPPYLLRSKESPPFQLTQRQKHHVTGPPHHQVHSEVACLIPLLHIIGSEWPLDITLGVLIVPLGHILRGQSSRGVLQNGCGLLLKCGTWNWTNNTVNRNARGIITNTMMPGGHVMSVCLPACLSVCLSVCLSGCRQSVCPARSATFELDLDTQGSGNKKEQPLTNGSIRVLEKHMYPAHTLLNNMPCTYTAERKRRCACPITLTFPLVLRSPSADP